MGDIGDLLFDKDAMYVNIPDNKVFGSNALCTSVSATSPASPVPYAASTQRKSIFTILIQLPQGRFTKRDEEDDYDSDDQDEGTEGAL